MGFNSGFKGLTNQTIKQPPNLTSNHMEQGSYWESNRSSADQEIPCILCTWRFVTTFTCTHHLSQPSARSILFMPPHPTSWQSILNKGGYL